MIEEFWGELRSLCVRDKYGYNAEYIGHHITVSEVSEEERMVAIEYAAEALLEWPEQDRVKAKIPYVPWLLVLCERMLEAESRGDNTSFEAAARLVHAFKPNAVPLVAARKRQELRHLVREHGWQAAATAAVLAEESQELSRQLRRLDPKNTLLEKVEIADRDGQGEFKYVLISRPEAFDGLCALQVLWGAMPKEVLAKAGGDILDFLWGMVAALAYDTDVKDTSPTRACPYADLGHLGARPLRRGFGQPIKGQDDLIQVILSGVGLLGEGDDLNLARLRSFSSGAGVGERLLWATGEFSQPNEPYWQEPEYETYRGLLRHTFEYELLGDSYLINELYDMDAWGRWQPSAW